MIGKVALYAFLLNFGLAEWLVKQKVDQVFMTEDLSHEGPSYVFSNAGVAVQRTAAERLEEIFENLSAE